MSIVIRTLTPFAEKDVLLLALQDMGVQTQDVPPNIITDRQDQRGAQMFVWQENQFYFQHDSDANNLQANFKTWQTTDSFLQTVETFYQTHYASKMTRLAEEDKKRVETERVAFVASQEKRIVEKAKALGYKVEKRVEKNKGVQFVLVKRTA